MLRRFLAALPKTLSHEDTKAAKVNVFKACYYALSGEGACISELFENIDSSQLESLRNYAWDPSLVESTPFYKHTTTTGYTHVKGDACARILTADIAQYRCSECFYDDTCVLCEDCFNPEDHKGHRVTKYVSLGSGMCDCGDDSAFLRKLNCKCLRVSPDTSLSPTLQFHLELVIKTVLDFIIDVGNRCILTLPEVNKCLANSGTKELLCDAMELCTLPFDKYGTEFDRHDLTQLWHLVMWKQHPEQFSVPELAIKAALDISPAQARDYCGKVRAFGRCVISSSPDYEVLLLAQKKLLRDFIVTIQPSSLTVLENVVNLLLAWLEDICCSNWNFALKTQSKRVIGQCLLEEPSSQPSRRVLSFLIDKFSKTTVDRFPIQDIYEGSLYKYILKESSDLQELDFNDLSMNFTFNRLSQPLSRVQLLLTYDLRFCSEVRLRLNNLIILALMHDFKYKQIFSLQYIDAFPSLLILLAAADSLVDDSLVQSISVQVFMCPPTNNMIVNSTKLANVFGPVIHLILSHQSQINPNGFLNLKRTDLSEDSLEECRLYNTIKVALYTITNMFSKNNAQNILNALLEEKNLVIFTMFQSLVQGLGPVKRETTIHVEREDFEQANFVFRTAMSFLGIIKDADVAVDLSIDDIRQGIPIVLKLMARTKNQYWNSSHEVSKRPVSFVNPASFLLCILIKRAGFENVKQTILQHNSLFTGIFDYSLQSCVLGAQTKIGTWVRNGDLLAALASYYSGEVMASVSYHNDFHAVQIAALTQDPAVFFDHLVSKWELKSWLSNEVQVDKTVYEDRFPFAFEQFIIFLYNLFTERCFFDDYNKARHELYVASKTLIYSLAGGPQPFSVLWSTNKTRDMSVKSFEELLHVYADYSAPQGLLDSGVYRLKDAYLEDVDPISLFLDSGSSQSTFLALVENISKAKKTDVCRVILKPSIHQSESKHVNTNIGNFLHTKVFAKFVHKVLIVGLESKDQGIIFPALHLVHAILLEDERLHGRDYINKYFLEFPICNAFLFIVDAQISPSISAKAELLLDVLISKDENVVHSLTSCFGELHIRNYQAKRKDPSDKKRKRSKDAAEARKAKILSKLAKQRQSFLAKNTLDDDAKRFNEHKAKCLACGEPECIDQKFGVPISYSTSTISWYIPSKSSPYFWFSFKDYWDQPDNFVGCSGETSQNNNIVDEHKSAQNIADLTSPQETSQFEAEEAIDADDNSDSGEDSKSSSQPINMGPIFPKEFKSDVKLPFTCNHTIHEKCFLGTTRNGHFECPLCHLQFSRILPTYYYLDESFIPKKWLDGLPKAEDYCDLQADLDLSKNDDLLLSVLDKEYFENGKLLPSVYKPTFDTFRLQKPDEFYLFERLLSITDLIGNSIRSHEIASRVDGKKGMSHFVVNFPSSAIALNRSLIQSRVLLFNEFKEEYSQMKLEELLSKYYSFYTTYNNCILDVLSLFFQTGESLTTCFRVGFAMLIAQTLAVLYDDHLPFSIPCEHVTSELSTSMKVFVELFHIDIHACSDNMDQDSAVYAALEKCVVPYLKHCVLLKHILTCERAGDNEYIISEEFDSLLSYTDSWTAKDYISLLCSILNICTLEDIITCFRKLNEALTFEVNVLRDLVPEFMMYRDLRIEYPNVQRLVNLPNNYQDIRSVDKFVYLLSFICLHCGEQVKCEDAANHRKECASISIFYGLKANEYFVGLSGSKQPFEAVIPGPYMTEHGEVKKDKVPGRASLNLERYNYMNKLWLNNEFYGIVLRSTYDFDSDPLGLDMPESDIETDNELLDNWTANEF